MVYITPYWTTNKIFKLCWSYFFICFIASYWIEIGNRYTNNNNNDILYGIWIFGIIIFCIIVLIYIIIFYYFHTQFQWKLWINDDIKNTIFYTPFVPILPLIIIFVNCYFVATFQIHILIGLLVLLISGFIFYLMYGYHWSILNFIHNNKHKYYGNYSTWINNIIYTVYHNNIISCILYYIISL